MSAWKRLAWVNLWMVVFSVAAIWAIVCDLTQTQFGSGVPWVQYISALVILAIVLIVGFLRLPVSLFYEPGARNGPTMNDLAGVYITAWKRIWRQKWILWVFGPVAALNIVGRLAEHALSRHYLADLIGGELSRLLMSGTSPYMYLTVVLPGELARITSGAPEWFFPHPRLSQSPGPATVLALTILLSIPWASRRLKTLANDGAYSRDARFMRVMLIVAAIASFATLAVVPREFIRTLTGLAADSSRFPHTAVSTILISGLSLLAQSVIVNAILLAGFAGSLLRAKRPQPVTGATFVLDAVRYFKPVAGVYLVVAIIGYLRLVPMTAELPMAARLVRATAPVVLMLAPYAAVMRNSNAWNGIRRGVTDWFSHAGQIISFVAIGITFIMIVLILTSMLDALASPMSPFYAARLLISVAISTLLAAIMALAVWEFYCLVSSAGDRDAPRKTEVTRD